MAEPLILLVEDEPTLLETISYNLEKEGFRVITAADGMTGLELAQANHPDLVLLDIMLPGMSGLEACRLIRKSQQVPILFLTARDEEIDKVIGLEIGADDYVTKPFSMRELMARVRAHLRRAQVAGAAMEKESAGVLKIGDISLDPERHEVIVSGEVVALRPKEFDLLHRLMAAKGKVLTRDSLLETVWGYEYAGDTRTVDVHIRWLREKIEPDPSSPRYIHTVRNVGYKFEDTGR